MCCGTRTRVNNSGERPQVVEYLGGKAVYERHSCRQKLYCEFCEELCQVGIEHMHCGALRRTGL
jgi:uncharacterized protein YbcV (DUF1398 family)